MTSMSTTIETNNNTRSKNKKDPQTNKIWIILSSKVSFKRRSYKTCTT